MKAIRVRELGAPEVLVLEEVPDPVPGRGEILVRLHAAGVNPVDVYRRSGAASYRTDLPYTPGHDGAGEVLKLGPEVGGFLAGDRVYIGGRSTPHGTYAERTVVAAQNLFPLSERLSFEQGAGIRTPYLTAYRALHQRGRARPGETVLVHGASGGVGTASVQLAVAHDMVVIGTAGSDRGKELVHELGARHVLDHHDPGHLARAREITEGRGLDLILEMLANVNLGSDLPALAPRGRVVVIGSRGTVQINPRETMGREAEILGVSLGSPTDEEMEVMQAALASLFEDGTLSPVVGRSVPLAEAPEAHRAVMRPGAYGKIVLVN
ncbi:MAG: NADPH:quinone reductase [Anaerolineae bacterium]